jgi:hypothetical protein
VRSSSEEIARHVEELSPHLPAAFLAHDDLSRFAEDMARQAAEEAARDMRQEAETAAREAATAAREEAKEAAKTAANTAAQAAQQAAAAASRGAAVSVRDSLAAIDRARSQAEILAALLSEARHFADRTAVLLVRGGEMRGWAGQGFGEAGSGADAALRELSFTPATAGGWSRLPQAQSAAHLNAADCAELCSRIEAPLPHEGVLIPLILRDRVAAGVYADRTAGLPAVEALQVLCFVAAQSIELLPFRERAFTPTLAAEEGLAYMPPPAPEAPAATEATAAEPDVEAEPEAHSDSETAPEPEAPSETGPEPPAEDVAALWEPAPDSEQTAPEQLAPDIEALPELPASLDDTASEPPAPAATDSQPVPRQGLRAVDANDSTDSNNAVEEPQPSAAATRMIGLSADETVLLQRPSLREVPAPEPAAAPAPLRPVPAPLATPVSEPAAVEAPSSLSGIPEVKPPSGVEGPGWAFATSRVAVSPGDEAQHEEARRLARLLVSEIKLYNEEQVEEGRRKKDVYERLKEDIDRSRQMYEERVEPRILKSTDYFYQELVRILAAGDAKALGI